MILIHKNRPLLIQESDETDKPNRNPDFTVQGNRIDLLEEIKSDSTIHNWNCYLFEATGPQAYSVWRVE